MELTLKESEVELLRGILHEYVSNLRTEICGTDSYDVREFLKAQEKEVREVVLRLERPVPVRP